MTTAQHTPGPWAAAPTGEIMRGYSQPYCVAELGSTDLIAGCFGDIKGGEEVAKANARLIAAAPDMLDELEAARKMIIALALDLSAAAPEAINVRIADDEIRRLNALIAKAEGRS